MLCMMFLQSRSLWHSTTGEPSWDRCSFIHVISSSRTSLLGTSSLILGKRNANGLDWFGHFSRNKHKQKETLYKKKKKKVQNVLLESYVLLYIHSEYYGDASINLLLLNEWHSDICLFFLVLFHEWNKMRWKSSVLNSGLVIRALSAALIFAFRELA